MRTLVICLLALALGSAVVVRASDDAGHDASAGADAAEEHEMVEVEKVQGHRGSAVVELGSSAVVDEGVYDWIDVVGKDLPVVVEFYLPSCGHCQGFAPEYERVARAFHSQPVIVARIDANRWTKISDHYRVKSVPDIRYFPARSTADQPYIRARVASDLVDFINEYAGTTVTYAYSFRQQHGAAGAAAVVDEGTCPVVHAAALVEADAAADSEAATASALAQAEEEAAAADDAVEDADEEADELEEEAEQEAAEDAEHEAEDQLQDEFADAESEETAHEIESEIADDAEVEDALETEADEEEADI